MKSHLLHIILMTLVTCFGIAFGFATDALADDSQALDQDLAEQWATRDIPAQTGTPVFLSQTTVVSR